jgi:DNA-binding MarR family transcriptional regulator
VTLNIGYAIDELSSWSPRERIVIVRRWLAGSLSVVHLHVLTVLEADGPMRMGKLAEALGVSIASATGIVDRMEQRGLVERRHQVGDDRRIVLVHPTAAGLAVFTRLDERHRARVRAVLERLSAEELAGFVKGMRALRAANDAIEPDAAGPATGSRSAAEAPAR